MFIHVVDNKFFNDYDDISIRDGADVRVPAAQ